MSFVIYRNKYAHILFKTTKDWPCIVTAMFLFCSLHVVSMLIQRPKVG